jgi:hypothetical protein
MLDNEGVLPWNIQYLIFDIRYFLRGFVFRSLF